MNMKSMMNIMNTIMVFGMIVYQRNDHVTFKLGLSFRVGPK